MFHALQRDSPAITGAALVSGNAALTSLPSDLRDVTESSTTA
jgi:hypothetical protein